MVSEPSERLAIGETDRLEWFDDFVGGMLGGGIYLLGGSPGGRKSGLATQIVLELATRGIASVSVLTEESERRFVERVTKITTGWTKKQARDAVSLARCDARISDLSQLPNFLLRDVLNPHGKYHGSKLIVIDSVQGHATPGTAMRKYQSLFEFDQVARSAGITVILICQLTKSNRLSGPRALEHHADVVLQLAKVGDFRVLALTKNRFGPEQPNGTACRIPSSDRTMRRLVIADPIEKTVLSLLRKTLMQSADLQSRVEAAVREQLAAIERDSGDLSDLMKQREKIEAQLEFVLEELSSIGKDAAKAKVRKLEAQLALIDERMVKAAALKSGVKTDPVAATDQIMNRLAEMGSKLDKLPNHALRSLLSILIARLEVDMETLNFEIELAIPNWAAFDQKEFEARMGLDEN